MQFEVNAEILALNKQDLIIADESEFGWLTVAKIRDKPQQQSSVITKRDGLKPPEEILHDIAKRQSAGNSSHCGRIGH